MASPPIFIDVSLHLMGTREEIPRNAHKPPLPPIAVDPLSHRSSLENALCQLSFPLDFFFCLRSTEKKSFNWF